MDFELLLELREYLSVVHHLPGRIRIKFSLKLLGDHRARQLVDSFRGMEMPLAIRSARLNPLGRSVVIEYDPRAIDPNKLDAALTTRDVGRFDELADELRSVLIPV